MDNRQPGRRPAAHGPAKRPQGPCHGGLNGLRRFALHHPQASVSVWKKEIHLQPLLVSKMVQLLPHGAIDLTLQYLRRDMSFIYGFSPRFSCTTSTPGSFPVAFAGRTRIVD